MYFDRTKKQNGYIFKPLSMKEPAKKRLKEPSREEYYQLLQLSIDCTRTKILSLTMKTS